MQNKTYSLRELSLCSAQLTHNFYDCEKDPSCQECFDDQEEWKQKYYQYVERLVKEFEKEEARELIRNYVMENYGPPTDDKVIVVIASDKER
eukprot:UN01016